MADLSPDQNLTGKPATTPARSPGAHGPPRMPLWVKVFGIIGLVLILLVVVLFVIGGGPGGEHGPGRHLPSSGGSEETGGVGGPADAGSATRTIAVTTLDNMTFEPTRITVSEGETVTFAVTNTGQVVHEFVLGDAAMQQQRADQRTHMGDMTPHDGTNSVHLQPGETKEITWRFGDTGIEYVCHEPGHYQAGMRGQITIEDAASSKRSGGSN